MGTKESDVKFDFDPWDGTPGDAYDKFEIRLLNNGSKTDDRGWSLSDHLLGDDEGGPNIGAPAMPVGPPAQLLKAQQARRKRQKESYGILAKHVTNKDITEDLQRNHFQDGRAAFLAIRASGQVAVDQLQLRELDKEWDGISILHDIGINENTIGLLVIRIKAVNSKRPANRRKNETDMA